MSNFIAGFAAGAWTTVAAYGISYWHAGHKRRRTERYR